MPENYYDSLQVPPDADEDAIASAYLRLREQHHPKNNPDDPLAAEIIRYLDSAFAVLMEPERRRSYDEALRNGHSPNGALTLDMAAPTQADIAAPAPAVEAPPQGRVGAYFRRTFASLAIRDYRLLLSGNIITQFGTWFQNIGINWLVFVVTGSAFTMGVLAAWRGVITLFLSPFGGVWADRVDRRTLVITFTLISALEATRLAVFVYTGWIAPGTVPLDRFLIGTPLAFLVTQGLTKPGFSSFLPSSMVWSIRWRNLRGKLSFTTSLDGSTSRTRSPSMPASATLPAPQDRTLLGRSSASSASTGHLSSGQ